ncbi:MAG: hypothetical protein MHM6MM_006317 [Cercozoa sp. M6MM]
MDFVEVPIYGEELDFVCVDTSNSSTPIMEVRDVGTCTNPVPAIPERRDNSVCTDALKCVSAFTQTETERDEEDIDVSENELCIVVTNYDVDSDDTRASTPSLSSVEHEALTEAELELCNSEPEETDAADDLEPLLFSCKERSAERRARSLWLDRKKKSLMQTRKLRHYRIIARAIRRNRRLLRKIKSKL